MGPKRIAERAAEKLGEICVGVMHFVPVARKPGREVGASGTCGPRLEPGNEGVGIEEVTGRWVLERYLISTSACL